MNYDLISDNNEILKLYNKYKLLTLNHTVEL